MSYNSERDPEYSERPYPKLAFLHAWGWEVIASAPNRFRLINREGKYVAPFTTQEAAINYMNAEFL